jgi:drug/metabolite transporter (DMT)-like permease
VDIALALAAALFFAFGTVLQQRAGLEKPTESEGAGLLVAMAKRPVWLAGIAADGIGFLCQAVALAIGRLAVVQPLLVATVVFALPLGAKLTGQRVRRIDVAAALVVLASLVAFLLIADPSGGMDDAPLGQWLVAFAISAAICVPVFLLRKRGTRGRRAAALGVATGILFALSAALTKAVADQFGEAVVEIFVHWHLYALVVIGYASMTFNQLALNTGALAPAVATSLAFDPITSVVLGVTLLDESLHTSPLGLIGTVLALGAALGGMTVLARSQSQAQGPGSQAPAGPSPAPA